MQTNRDHCTALPDKWVTEEMNACCLAHDNAYVTQALPKYQADWEFYQCLSKEIDFLPAVVLAGLAAIGGICFWYRRKFKNMIK